MKPQGLALFQKIHALRGRLLNHGGDLRTIKLQDLNALEKALLDYKGLDSLKSSDFQTAKKAGEFLQERLSETGLNKDSQTILLDLLLEFFPKEPPQGHIASKPPIPPSSSPRLATPIPTPSEPSFMERLWKHFQEEVSSNWFLFLGAAMVFAAGIFYTLSSWENFKPMQQFLFSFSGLGLLAASEVGLRKGLNLRRSPRVFGLVFLFLLPLVLHLHFSLGWSFFLPTWLCSALILNLYRGSYLPKPRVALIPLHLYFLLPLLLFSTPKDLGFLFELGSALGFLFLQKFWKNQSQAESTGIYQGLTCFTFSVAYLPFLDGLTLAWVLSLFTLQWLFNEGKKIHLGFLYGAGFLLLALCLSFEAWVHLYSAGWAFVLVLDRFNLLDSHKFRSNLTLALGTALGCLTSLFVSVFAVEPQSWHLLVLVPLIFLFQITSLKRWKLQGHSYVILATWLVLIPVFSKYSLQFCLHSIFAALALLILRSRERSFREDLELGLISSFAILPWIPTPLGQWVVALFWLFLSVWSPGSLRKLAKIRLSAFFLSWGALVFLFKAQSLALSPQFIFLNSFNHSRGIIEVFPWLQLLGFFLLSYILVLRETHIYAFWVSFLLVEFGLSLALLSLPQPLGIELPFLLVQIPVFVLFHPHLIQQLRTLASSDAQDLDGGDGLRIILALVFIFSLPGLFHSIAYLLPCLLLFWIYRMGAFFWISFSLCLTLLISGPGFTGEVNLYWSSALCSLFFWGLHHLNLRFNANLFRRCRADLEVDFRAFFIGTLLVSSIAWLVPIENGLTQGVPLNLGYLGSMTALILLAAHSLRLSFLSYFLIPIWMGVLIHPGFRDIDFSFYLVLGFYALLIGLGGSRSPLKLGRSLWHCSLAVLSLGFLRTFTLLPPYQGFILALSASAVYFFKSDFRYALHLLACMVVLLSLTLMSFAFWAVFALVLGIAGWVCRLKERELLWKWTGTYFLIWAPFYFVERSESGLILTILCLAIHQFISAKFFSRTLAVYFAALLFGMDYGLARLLGMIHPGEYSSYGLIALALLLGFLASRLPISLTIYRLPFNRLSKILPLVVMVKESLESGSPWVYLVSGLCYEFLEDSSKLSYTRLLGLICYNLACFAFFSPGDHLLEALSICSGFSVLWYARTLESVLERKQLQGLKLLGNFLFYAGMFYDFVYQSQTSSLFYLWGLCIIGGWLALIFKARLQLFFALMVFLFSLGFFLIRQLILQVSVGIVGIGALGFCLIVLGTLIEKNREKIQVLLGKLQENFASWKD